MGAGGNAGAVIAGFLFKGDLPWPTAFLFLGVFVSITAFLIPLVRFSESDERLITEELQLVSVVQNN